MRDARIVLVLAFLGCGSSARTVDTPPVRTCAHNLSPRALQPASSGTLQPFPDSLIVVNAEFPLKKISSALEARAPKRVAEEKDHDIGMAGRLQYTVDRGKFSVAVDGDAIVVSLPLSAQVEACAKGRCYASCAPEAKATAKIPMKLGGDERLHVSEVKLDVTKGCSLRAGFLNIDVTPTLRSELDKRRPQVMQAIDRELPDPRPQLNRVWAELEKPRPVPLGGCLVLSPESIVVGPASGTSTHARVRLGVHARPELRAECGEASLKKARPPIRAEALGESGDIHLATVVADETLRGAFISRSPVDLVPNRASTMNASGGAQSLVLTLSGDVCGDVEVRANGVTKVDETHIALRPSVLGGGEDARLAEASVSAAEFAQAIEQTPIRIPIAPGDLKAILPDLAAALSDDSMALSAKVNEAELAGGALRANGLFAIVRLNASATLSVK